ncbi:MAG: hypothetical protein GY898_03855 [Proteobacteria bacterium]|nr:hypothetical protein [Pseudomonadota bacterium]
MARSSQEVRLIRLDDPEGFRVLDQEQSLILADVRTPYTGAEPVRWSVALPPEMHRTVLRFERLKDTERGKPVISLRVIEGPVWHGGGGVPLPSSERLDRNESVSLEHQDKLYLSNREGERPLTIKIQFRTVEAIIQTFDQQEDTTSAPATPGLYESEQEPTIFTLDHDATPRGRLRQVKKWWRDLNRTWWIPVRKQMASVKYWVTQGKVFQKALVSVLSTVLMIVGLALAWSLKQKLDTDRDINLKVIAIQGGETPANFRPQPLTPGAETLARRFDGLADPAVQLVSKLLLPATPRTYFFPTTAPSLNPGEYVSWAEVLAEALERLPPVQGPLVRWCNSESGSLSQPLTGLRALMEKQGGGVAPIFAYLPAARTAYCPMYLDAFGRRGPAALRNDADGSRYAPDKAFLQRLARRRRASLDLTRLWSDPLAGTPTSSFWYRCEDADLREYVVWLQSDRPSGPLNPPASPEEEQAERERVAQVERRVAVALDPVQYDLEIGALKPDPRVSVNDAYNTAADKLVALMASYGGDREGRALDALMFALWEYDQGRELRSWLEQLAEDRGASGVHQLTYLGVRHRALQDGLRQQGNVDLPLMVLAWYLHLEPEAATHRFCQE